MSARILASAECMAVLKDGPATTGEIAWEVGVPSRTVCATMHHLMRLGQVARTPHTKLAGGKGRRHTSLWNRRAPQQGEG